MTSFRDVYDQVTEADAELLGISGDHLWAHKAYAKQMDGLPYPLLADWGMNVVKQYGVHNAERNTPKRVVFIVDRDGVIRFKNDAFDARDPGHYAQVLEELAKLP
jgi:peroxiredoxin Q/BCP